MAALERNNEGQSLDLLGESSAQLRLAADEMKKILSQAESDKQFQQYFDLNINLIGVSMDDREALERYFAKDKVPFPRTRRDLYAFFAAKTGMLADLVRKPDQRLEGIGDYLKLGQLVTRFMREPPRGN